MAEIIEIPSARARLELRRALDHVRDGGHTVITRYNDTEAVMVSPDWYKRACQLLAQADADGA